MPADDYDDPAAHAATEEVLLLPSLSLADAVELGLLALSLARAAQLPVLVEVTRAGGVAFRAALPGTSPDNDAWAAAKTRAVLRYGHSTAWLRAHHRARGTTFEAATGFGVGEYAAHGGGFPLAVAGTGVVGVLVVSGLPQADDHAFVVDVLRRYLAGERATLT